MTTTVTPTGISFNDLTSQTTVGAWGNVISRTYTATGPGYSWTIPAGLKWLKIVMYSGGGGGGASNSVATSYGGPGGNGGYVEMWYPGPAIIASAPSPSVPINIGTGGAGGTAPGGTGGTGGATTFGIFQSVGGGAGGSITPTGYGVPGAHGGGPNFIGGGGSGAGGVIGTPGGVSLNFGFVGDYGSAPPGGSAGGAGRGYGGGGGGGTTASTPTPGNAGGAGTPGAIFLEEHY